MLLKLRNWMLKTLAGNSPVMMNVLVLAGVVTLPRGTDKGFIYGCTFRKSQGMAISIEGGRRIVCEGNSTEGRVVPD